MVADRYPGADALGQSDQWDDATRDVVLDRVHNVPPFRHFDDRARATLEALCRRVIPQEHRPAERRVPIAPWIDDRCAEAEIGGTRFDDMPDEATAWALGLDGLDDTARILRGAPFAELDADGQDAVLEAVRGGDPPGHAWTQLPATRFWLHVALQAISGVYYSHPTAWDEIGFGGPAYPRGYTALDFGAREPWEAEEVVPRP